MPTNITNIEMQWLIGVMVNVTTKLNFKCLPMMNNSGVQRWESNHSSLTEI